MAQRGFWKITLDRTEPAAGSVSTGYSGTHRFRDRQRRVPASIAVFAGADDSPVACAGRRLHLFLAQPLEKPVSGACPDARLTGLCIPDAGRRHRHRRPPPTLCRFRDPRPGAGPVQRAVVAHGRHLWGQPGRLRRLNSACREPAV